jgi:hypothetical protein
MMKVLKKSLYFFMTFLFILPSISMAGNGCGTGWNTKLVRDSYGGAHFNNACDHHDACYETCSKSKSSCDKTLHSEMKSECHRTFHKGRDRLIKDACFEIAKGYYEGVKKDGEDAFKKAQRESNCSF